MKILKKVIDFQLWRHSLKFKETIGFVPTMGALHMGHLSLIMRSVRENDLSVVSIFVNPKQFGPREDLNRYPRPWEEDCRLLRQMGVKILFAPKANSMYPLGYATTVSVPGLTEILCGAPSSRGPEHFQGVATVVAKLFNLVRPRRAYFGLKDFQQVRVIEQMNQDLNCGVQIVRCPTVREKDGLAMSSRNRYLSPKERAVAPQLYAALQAGRKLLRSKKHLKSKVICQKVHSILAQIPGSKVEYIEVVHPDTLKESVEAVPPVLLAAAIKLGTTRLIDNVLVQK